MTTLVRTALCLPLALCTLLLSVACGDDDTGGTGAGGSGATNTGGSKNASTGGATAGGKAGADSGKAGADSGKGGSGGGTKPGSNWGCKTSTDTLGACRCDKNGKLSGYNEATCGSAEVQGDAVCEQTSISCKCEAYACQTISDYCLCTSLGYFHDISEPRSCALPFCYLDVENDKCECTLTKDAKLEADKKYKKVAKCDAATFLAAASAAGKSEFTTACSEP